MLKHAQEESDKKVIEGALTNFKDSPEYSINKIMNEPRLREKLEVLAG